VNPVHEAASISELEDAVRYVLIVAWHSSALGHKDIETLLANSWTGSILSRMQTHYESRVAARRAYEELNSPANVQIRREAKKRLKQEQHEMRLALKKERDKVWRERDHQLYLPKP
jgi:hypothetical protein